MTILYTYPASSLRSEQLQRDLPQTLCNTLHGKGIPLGENWINIDESVRHEFENAEWIKIATDIHNGIARFIFEYFNTEKNSFFREELYFQDQKFMGGGAIVNGEAFSHMHEGDNNEDDSPENLNQLQIQFTNKILSETETKIRETFDNLGPIRNATYWDRFAVAVSPAIERIAAAFQLAGEIARPIPEKELMFQAAL